MADTGDDSGVGEGFSGRGNCDSHQIDRVFLVSDWTLKKQTTSPNMERGS